MTTQEAIEILWQYDVNFEPHPAEEVMHAIDLAIEALKLVTIPDTKKDLKLQKSNDNISRQAAIEALGEEPDVWAGNDEYGRGLTQGLNNQWHYDVNALKAVTTAEERKVGTWKECHGNKNMCICQSCGFMINKSLLYDYTEKDPLVFKYCPSCGSYNGGES